MMMMICIKIVVFLEKNIIAEQQHLWKHSYSATNKYTINITQLSNVTAHRQPQ